MLKTFLIENYIEDHQGQYVGKYRYRCGYREDETTFKCRYYIMDESFRATDVYLEIRYKDHIAYDISVDLNDKERDYIVVDALKHILERQKHPSRLDYHLYDDYINGEKKVDYQLEPIDYVDLFDYMKYHRGISPKTIDAFYHMFQPSMEQLRLMGDYDRYLECLRVMFESAIYEYEWSGPTSKYLDCEYPYHLPYASLVLKMVINHLEDFYINAKDELIGICKLLLSYPRVAFMVMEKSHDVMIEHSQTMSMILTELKKVMRLSDVNQPHQEHDLAFSLWYYAYFNDRDQYIEVIKDYLRLIVNNTLVFANHEWDTKMGDLIIAREGYEVILDLFQDDFNSFIFTCFPISSFPEEMKLPIRKELEKAVFFFAARMEDEYYRLSSFEQTMNINRLMLENYREWYTQ